MNEKSHYEFKRVSDFETQQFDNHIQEVSIKIDDQTTVREMMLNFKRFLLACGFHKESIDEYIEDE